MLQVGNPLSPSFGRGEVNVTESEGERGGRPAVSAAGRGLDIRIGQWRRQSRQGTCKVLVGRQADRQTGRRTDRRCHELA